MRNRQGAIDDWPLCLIANAAVRVKADIYPHKAIERTTATIVIDGIIALFIIGPDIGIPRFTVGQVEGDPDCPVIARTRTGRGIGYRGIPVVCIIPMPYRDIHMIHAHVIGHVNLDEGALI